MTKHVESVKCNKCDKSFSTEDNLKEHMVIHLKGTKIECSACTKTFNRRKILNEHVRSHTGDKLFECRFCGKMFSKSELNRSCLNTKDADSSPAEAELKVEDKATGHTVAVIAEDVPEVDARDATETVDNNEVNKEARELLDEKQDYSPAAVGKSNAERQGRGIRSASPHLNSPQPSSATQPEPQALAINLIPKEELRNKFYTFVNHFSSFRSFSSLKHVMNYSDSLVKVRGIMAIASCCKGKRSIYEELTVLDYERADCMRLVVAMEEIVEMLTMRDLSGLAVYWDGCVCWTKERMGLAMKALLGPEKLAVFSPKSRNAGDTLFRSRKLAWIVRGRNLAQSVVKECEFCKVNQQKTLEQQITSPWRSLTSHSSLMTMLSTWRTTMLGM